MLEGDRNVAEQSQTLQQGLLQKLIIYSTEIMGMIHSQVTSHLIWPEFIASEPEEILFPKVSCFASVHALPSISSTALKQPGFLLTWLRPVLCRVPHSQFPSTHSYYSLADHSVTFRMLFPTFSPQFSGKKKKKHSMVNHHLSKGSVTETPWILAPLAGKKE